MNDKAETMCLRALQGKGKAWEASTLNAVNNLGLLYADQGKMAEAEAMYLRALQGYENAWGVEPTSTLDTVNNLGILYNNQGKMAEAEQGGNVRVERVRPILAGSSPMLGLRNVCK